MSDAAMQGMGVGGLGDGSGDGGGSRDVRVVCTGFRPQMLWLGIMPIFWLFHAFQMVQGIWRREWRMESWEAVLLGLWVLGAVVMLLVPVLGLLLWPRRMEVGDETLTVRRWVGTRRIALKELSRVRVWVGGPGDAAMSTDRIHRMEFFVGDSDEPVETLSVYSVGAGMVPFEGVGAGPMAAVRSAIAEKLGAEAWSRVMVEVEAERARDEAFADRWARGGMMAVGLVVFGLLSAGAAWWLVRNGSTQSVWSATPVSLLGLAAVAGVFVLLLVIDLPLGARVEKLEIDGQKRDVVVVQRLWGREGIALSKIVDVRRLGGGKGALELMVRGKKRDRVVRLGGWAIGSGSVDAVERGLSRLEGGDGRGPSNG
jgi:hypothetical protein